MDAQKVLEWMAEEDRTLAYLARQSGVSVDRLVAVLAGRAERDPELLAALEQVMGLDEGDLLPDPAQGTDPDVAAHLRCFTIEEVADRIRVRPDTVRKEIRAGRLRHIVVGDRGIRIPHSALEERLCPSE